MSSDHDSYGYGDSDHDSYEDEDHWLTELEPPMKKLWFITRAATSARLSGEDRVELAALREALHEDATYINTVFNRSIQFFNGGDAGHRVTTLLDWAVTSEAPDVVNLLLEYGANPDILVGEPDELHTCLFSICTYPVEYHRHIFTIASALVATGLDINAKMYTGSHNSYSTVLHHACDAGNYEMVKMFLDHNANVYAVDSEGMTPLVVAVTPSGSMQRDVGMLPIIRTLVAHGADLHAIDRFGQTLLHRSAINPYAAHDNRYGPHYRMDVVQYLVENGVSDIRDLNGMSAADVAVKEYGLNSLELRLSRLFGTCLQAMLDDRQRRLVAFAMGYRGHDVEVASNRHASVAHDWRRMVKGALFGTALSGRRRRGLVMLDLHQQCLVRFAMGNRGCSNGRQHADTRHSSARISVSDATLGSI
jgi:hypothetical protein